MLDIKAQSQIAEAATVMARAYVLATAYAASASAGRGVTVWSQMLRLSARRQSWCTTGWAALPLNEWASSSAFAWHPLAVWAAWGRACAPLPDMPRQGTTQPPIAPPAPTAVDPTFSSYRSSGGHAAAQVVVG